MNKQEARERAELMLAMIKTVNFKNALGCVEDILEVSPDDDADRKMVFDLQQRLDGLLRKSLARVADLNAWADASGMDGL
jgi:hypothetical protein